MNGVVGKYLPIGLVAGLLAVAAGYGALGQSSRQHTKDIDENKRGINRIYPRLNQIENNQTEQRTRAEVQYSQTQKTLDEIKELIRERR